MKVLHLTTYDSGGAGGSCYRLHQSLIEAGVDSQLLVLHKKRDDHTVHLYEPTIPERIMYRSFRRRTQKLRCLEPDAEILTTPCTIYDVAKHPLVKSSDIIHMHWVSNFVDFRTFFKRVAKPLFWTLHDINPTKGTYHYPMDSPKLSKAIKLERKGLKVRAEGLSPVDDVQIVCPSKWIYSYSLRSEMLKRFSHHYIPYGIDTSFFKPLGSSAKSEFDLSEHKCSILLVADYVNIKRKGLHLMKAALAEIENERVEVCVVGNIDIESVPSSWKVLGYLSDQSKLQRLYASVDFTITPSIEDNLPNVVLESLACGTPVIAFSIGGIPDMVSDGKNGFLSTSVDSNGLKNAISRAISHDEYDELRENARLTVLECFAFKLQGQRMAELYHNTLSKSTL